MFVLVERLANAAMTLPNACNDLLMHLASSNRIPLEPLCLIFSLPAKSTMFNLPMCYLYYKDV